MQETSNLPHRRRLHPPSSAPSSAPSSFSGGFGSSDGDGGTLPEGGGGGSGGDGGGNGGGETPPEGGEGSRDRGGSRSANEWSVEDRNANYLGLLEEAVATAGDKLTVNGCLDLGEPMTFAAAAIVSQLKFIVLTRDPPDLVWAAYNFWAIQGHDGDVNPGQWVGKSIVRSPEDFHALVLSGTWNWPGEGYSYQMRSLVNKFGRKNVLVVRNEDMADGDKWFEFLSKLSDFTGLDIGGFDVKMMATRMNCGDHKGSATACEVKTTGLYAISGFKPMLDETRTILNEKWSEYCVHWKEEYGIVYEECVSVPSSS